MCRRNVLMFIKSRCINYRCTKNNNTDSCIDTTECWPGFYCNSNKCQLYKNENELCNDRSECKRDASCIIVINDTNINNPTELPGKCINYDKLEAGTRIRVRSEYDIFTCKGGIAESLGIFLINSIDYLTITEADAENMANNFRVGVEMTCGIKLYSSNKGSACRTFSGCFVERDVASGDNTIRVKLDKRYADCQCYYDDTGYPRCGLMNGDKEFDEYRQAFFAHVKKSMNCHSFRGYDYECGNEETYYKL